MSRITGYSGCCCLFDVGILKIFLSESGCPGLKDLQDVVILLSMRNRDFGIIDKINYLLNY
jgi:hypothetical protein